ncbi:kinase-like domain-containing protein [Trametes maxima]|nr:kinase-like domain-containing protein [Trametes maxima]
MVNCIPVLFPTILGYPAPSSTPSNTSSMTPQSAHIKSKGRRYGLNPCTTNSLGLSSRMAAYSLTDSGRSDLPSALSFSIEVTLRFSPKGRWQPSPPPPASVLSIQSSPLSSRPSRQFLLSPAASIYIATLQDSFGIPPPRPKTIVVAPLVGELYARSPQASHSTVHNSTVGIQTPRHPQTTPDAPGIQEPTVRKQRSMFLSRSVRGLPQKEVDVPQDSTGTQYQVFGKLGEGAYGRVLAAGTSKGEVVALKVISKPKMYQDPDAKILIRNERNVMVNASKAGFRSIVKIEAAWEQGDNIYFAMPLHTEDLRSRLRRTARNKEAISASEMKLMCAEMLVALDDLSRLAVIHGDIKPDNFLVAPTGHIVLADLGLAQGFSNAVVTGTPGYYAPEALISIRTPKERPTFGWHADVFSLGLVFVELFCGLDRTLWDTTPDEPEGLNIDPEAWRNMGDHLRQAARMMTEGLSRVLDGDMIADADARDLVCQMLRPDYQERPRPRELLAHKYFSELDVDRVRGWRIPHEYTRRDVHLRPCSPAEGLTFDDVALLKHSGAYAELSSPLSNFAWPRQILPPGPVSRRA